ncbi:hypothetical protein PV328_012310 [Microctonus aethiopoides]|uniref:BEN domain-containing protein n=1 Tax=Microctonus aethiopoides TaxID=144406 RepID=A0AA39FGM4_9HYME|nr:hypothetical protein PV328_012310 [Microctonus aethiopoides]
MLQKETTKKKEEKILKIRTHSHNTKDISIDSTVDVMQNEELPGKNIDNSECPTCSLLPQITSEMITNLETMLNILKMHHKYNKKKTESDSNSAACATEPKETACGLEKKLPHWRIPDFGKVELVEKSGVWFKESEIDFIVNNTSSKNPNEIIRKLFKLALGENNIYKYCAIGQKASNKMGVPQDLRNAIYKYVKKMFPTHNMDKLNRVVNLMCSSAAIKKNGKKLNNFEPISQQPPNPLPLPQQSPHQLPLLQEPPSQLPLSQQPPSPLPFLQQPPNQHPFPQQSLHQLPSLQQSPSQHPFPQQPPSPLPFLQQPPSQHPFPQQSPHQLPLPQQSSHQLAHYDSSSTNNTNILNVNLLSL